MTWENCKFLADNDMRQRTWNKFTVSGMELSRLVGRSFGCIERWTKYGGLPTNKRGRYHLKTALSWIEQHYKHSLTIKITLNNLTQQQLAGLLGVTRKSLRRWEAKEDLPRNDNGKYDLRCVAHWLRKKYKEKLNLGDQK